MNNILPGSGVLMCEVCQSSSFVQATYLLLPYLLLSFGMLWVLRQVKGPIVHCQHLIHQDLEIIAEVNCVQTGVLFEQEFCSHTHH